MSKVQDKIRELMNKLPQITDAVRKEQAEGWSRSCSAPGPRQAMSKVQEFPELQTPERMALLISAQDTQIASLTSQLAECYRLSGADEDGNEDWRLALHAVAEVKRMREESDAELASLNAQVEELRRAIGSPVLCDGGHFVAESDSGKCPTCIERGRRIIAEAELAALREGAWPQEMPMALRGILGLICLTFIGPANVYRKAGFAIKERAEEEQAFFLHRLIGFWFKHGDKWNDAAKAELKQIYERIIPKESETA